ncbi:MAG: FAD-dependent oxidoreductase [Gammaproteobacteria bacterium]|nr:FAD-dependent oxidoreductase [Gammaproteobacteria bacterium]
MPHSGIPQAIHEEARELRVVDAADVLVVGGGPAGIGAAVAAARSGARTVLVERYGHLGGMATGGLVILLPHLSDGSTHQDIMGISQEWIERLDRIGGAVHPDRSELGSTDAASIEKWRHYFSCVVNDRVRQSVYVDPELLKCVLNDMVEEAGIKLYLHSWGCRAIMAGTQVRGVTFESKEGRQAILGKLTIDCTGDGDVVATSGAAFEGGYDEESRSAMLAVVFRLGNVNFRDFCAYRDACPQEWQAIQQRIFALGNFRLAPFPTHRNDVMWVNNWVPGRSCLNVTDLTWTEINVRKAMRGTQQILQREVPGFRDCFILDTASQLGTRGSRRVIGEHQLTLKEVSNVTPFEDVIAVFPSLRPAGRNGIQVPYRTLVPREVDGLLVAGRCFSSDAPANNLTNLIPHCIATGQAAGTAAALALDAGVSVRAVDVRALQRSLRHQGVPLPEGSG